MEDSEALELSIKFATDGREGNRELRKQGRKCLDFVKGTQWDPADVASLEAQGAVALTINHCLPIRDNIAGRQRQNRKDWRVRPVKGATALVANVLTAMLKNVSGNSNLQFIDSAVFTMGITTGRGFRGIDIDKTKDPLKGDLIAEYYSPFNVDPDPLSCEFDLNTTGKYISAYKWMDKDQIHALYPDAVDELGGTVFNKDQKGIGATLKRVKNFLFGKESKSGSEDELEELDEVERFTKMKEYRYWVRKSWFKTYKEIYYWLDYTDKQIKRLTEDDKLGKARESVRNLPDRFKLIKHTIPVLHKVLAIDDVLLEYVEDPFKFADSFSFEWGEDGPQVWEVGALFPIVPYYSYFEDGNIFGKIDNLIGPQLEENKRRTQFLRIINSVASSGWMHKKGTLSKDMIDLLKEKGARPGIMIEYDGEPPTRIQPVNTPAAHLTAALTAKEDMKEISAVNVDVPAHKGESGYAIALSTNEGLIGSEIVIDNFDYSSALFGQVILEAIRCGEFYSEAEISAIIDDEELIDQSVLDEAIRRLGRPPTPPPPPQQGLMDLAKQRFGQKGEILSMAVGELYQKKQEEYEGKAKIYDKVVKALAKHLIIEKIKDIRTGKYGITVSESPNAPTQRMANFSYLLEIEKLRPKEIPFEEFIKASDLPNKDDIITARKQQQTQLAGLLPAGAAGAAGAAK